MCGPPIPEVLWLKLIDSLYSCPVIKVVLLLTELSLFLFIDPSRFNVSCMITCSLLVHGKNMQSILFPSGPSSMMCFPSNVSIRINFAWSSLPKLMSSKLKQQHFLTLERIAIFKSSVKFRNLSMFR